MKLDADHYQNNSWIQRQLAFDLLENAKITHVHNILDIGCGDGFITSELSMKLKANHTLGIDPSEEMISYAINKYQSSNIKFKTGKAESKHRLDSYDLITAFSCLHWCRALPTALHNIHGALNRNGIFLGLTFPYESEFWQPFIRTLEKSLWKKYLNSTPIKHWTTHKVFSEIANQHDFKLLELQSLDKVAHYKSFKSLRDYISGWLPCFLNLEEPYMQERLLDEILDDAKSNYSENSGEIMIPYTVLQFVLQK